LAEQQSPPCPGQAPPPLHTLHWVCAAPAQMPSQAVSQQKGSAAQMALQQATSSQPGVPLAEQQSPPCPGQAPPPPLHTLHWATAALAQMPSQAVLQQKGSAAQMAWQQATSSHPGVPLAEQQSPLPGPHGPASAADVTTVATRAARDRMAAPIEVQMHRCGTRRSLMR
jgi:hypothetical protein